MSTAPLQQLSDGELVGRIRAGDGRAFEFVMRRHNRMMFRAARAILGSDADAEDAVQEAYVRAYHGLAGFRGEAKLSTWLVRIVVNQALGQRRSHSQALQAAIRSEQDEEAVQNVPGGDSPEEAMMRNELCRVLESSVDRLPQDYRTVFMLRTIEGLSVADTAACLGISPALVKVRLFRARHLLRTMLERELTPSLGETFAFAGARCDRIVASVLARLGLDQASPEDA